jgi:hypothetical protein
MNFKINKRMITVIKPLPNKITDVHKKIGNIIGNNRLINNFMYFRILDVEQSN